MKKSLALSLIVHATILGSAMLSATRRSLTPEKSPIAVGLTRRAVEKYPIRLYEEGTSPKGAPSHGRIGTPDEASNPVGSSTTQDDSYSFAIRERIQSAVRYPIALRRSGRAGRVGLRFKIDENGNLGEVEIQESSGSSELDQAAVDAVHTTAPFGAPPTGRLTLRIPIEFRLRR